LPTQTYCRISLHFYRADQEMYKAIISDLDGTLLNSRHQVSERTRSTLKTLVEGGIKFIVATGRHILDVRGMRQTLGFDCDLITANGALVSAADDSVLFHHTLLPEVVEELIRITQGRLSLHVNVYMRAGWFVAREMPQLLEFHKDSGFTYRVTDLSRLDMTAIHKFFFAGKHEILVDLEKELLERFPRQANVVFSRLESLEVMAFDVNKGSAARETLTSNCLGLDDAISFGDGMNDCEMLAMTAKGFLMGNATERLKRALPDNPIIGSCDEDGVAQKLIEIFGL